jgi:hypothetical protein
MSADNHTAERLYPSSFHAEMHPVNCTFLSYVSYFGYRIDIGAGEIMRCQGYDDLEVG